nr:hypothetical protein [Brucella intermedia]
MLKHETAAAVGNLHDPVAVFDAGIGSYALVELIRRSQPQRDIIYFADRASFPYGAKSRDRLLSIMRHTIRYLTGLGAQTIVLASNAPSVMVLDALKSEFAVPVHGVAPPVSGEPQRQGCGHGRTLHDRKRRARALCPGRGRPSGGRCPDQCVGDGGTGGKRRFSSAAG